MSKYIKVYETLFPFDPVAKTDSRCDAIIADMRAIEKAKTEKKAAAIVKLWWWESPGELKRFIRDARKMMADMK